MLEVGGVRRCACCRLLPRPGPAVRRSGGSRLGTAIRRRHTGSLNCSCMRQCGPRSGRPRAVSHVEKKRLTGTVRISGVPWSPPAGSAGALRAGERSTLTPRGPLTARRRRLTTVEGAEWRDRWRDGAHAAAAAVNSWWQPRSAARGSNAPAAVVAPGVGTLSQPLGPVPLGTLGIQFAHRISLQVVCGRRRRRRSAMPAC